MGSVQWNLCHQGAIWPKEWCRSWKVFNYIAKGLGFATVQKLDRHKEKIKQLDEKYGHLDGPDSTWWIVGLADQRMRSERLERLRQRVEEKHAQLIALGQPQFSKFDP